MRQLVEQTRTIDGVQYRAKPLATRAALRTMTRVLRLAGPGFADVASLRDAAAATQGALGRFVTSALEGVSDEMASDLCETFAEVSDVNTGASWVSLHKTWEEHFRGDLAALFQWIAFCAEVTYGPLLASLGVQRSAAPGAPAGG